jgi:hypothetical protein
MLSPFFSEHAWTHADLLGCDAGYWNLASFFVLSIYDCRSELKVYGAENPRIFPGPLALAYEVVEIRA